MQLAENAKFLRLSGAIAAATTDVTNMTSVDMKGYDSVTILACADAITASAVTSIKVQQSSDDGSADDWSDLEGTSVSIADDADNTMSIVEVIKPQKRYVRLYIDRGTANAAFEGVYAIQFGPKSGPVTQSTTDVATLESHLTPDEGTA